MRIAAIGDIHEHFDDEDVRFFNGSNYDLLLFVGDLAGYARGGIAVARRIAQLTKPALVIAGNHDGVSLGHLAAEAFNKPRFIELFEGSQHARCEALERALGDVSLCGYSRHVAGDVTIIAARPHAMGGDRFYFRRHISRRFGIDSFEQSAARLCQLVDDAEGDLVFLAHNGPSGLGAERHHIWGCDFRARQGDFGDPDLRAAIDHARATGKRVRAVVAGHMHYRLKGGGLRRWRQIEGDVTYINAARVPRIFRRGGRLRRHHVRIVIRAQSVTADQVVV